MKIVVLDVETGGLVPKVASLLEIGIVLFDSDVHGTEFSKIDFNALPHLSIRIKMDKDDLMCDEFCRGLNKHLVDKIESGDFSVDGDYIYRYPEEVLSEMLNLLEENNFITTEECLNGSMKKSRMNILGKNYEGFDKNFLEYHIPGFKDGFISRMRKLDPSILYTQITDNEAANLKTCMERSGLYPNGAEVSHTAVQDCIDTLKVTLWKLLKS